MELDYFGEPHLGVQTAVGKSPLGKVQSYLRQRSEMRILGHNS